jgi:hypothetical protein
LLHPDFIEKTRAFAGVGSRRPTILATSFVEKANRGGLSPGGECM